MARKPRVEFEVLYTLIGSSITESAIAACLRPRVDVQSRSFTDRPARWGLLFFKPELPRIVIIAATGRLADGAALN